MINNLYASRWKDWCRVARKYTHGQEYPDYIHDALVYLWSRKDDFEFLSIQQTDLLIRRMIKFTILKSKRGLKAKAICTQVPTWIESNYRADDSDFELYGQQLMQVLKTYKPTYPIYFELKYIQGMSYDEIMQHMNLKSRSTVFNNYSEIRKILKHELAVE